jgi:Tfp pilus assembly protein PilP
MKKILFVTSIFFFAACNSSGDKAKSDSMSAGADTTASTATTTATMPAINSPYAVTYSSKFEVGDPKHAETVLALWKDWDNGNLAPGKDRFADNVEFHFSDGSMMKTTRDSAIAMAQKIRDSYASSVSRVDAVMSVKSLMNNESPKDQNQNWALIWGMETNTDKKGKVDSSYLQETWRLNNDGKVDLVYQFRASAKPPKKK